ncbi:PLP-dependent aminotransferase family protein [Undibacterium sp. Ji50W]|uniref:MocR-like pyridoxine biosynthesis transcription factor PdxR n=1 Tax=Undibacterium sp. Ji50W TaxID=3413041 RepID=UPI003BF41DF5
MHVSSLIASITLDRQQGLPLYRQLYGEIRKAILGGQMLPGMQLPPSREFCVALGISRQTVLNAYDQLLAEGYLRGTVGQGTFVNEDLPALVEQGKSTDLQLTDSVTAENGKCISSRGQHYIDPRGLTRFHQGQVRAFRVSMPDLGLFPFEVWARLEARHYRHHKGQLGYGDPAGYRPLRELLAVNLKAARGVNCTPEQILITSGSQQALYLLATMLLDVGEQAWVEAPCYRGTTAALHAAQAQMCPVPVDAEGMDVAYAATHFPAAKLAFVTPSHQMPLGMTMSLQRRMALLDWAQQNAAWIVEDDYDSEYRFGSSPLASLQSLDTRQCVIYVGTLSKVLFPSLRLGYMVLPEKLREPLVQGKSVIDKLTAVMPQMVLTDFIAEGHFGRHIKRTRKIYAERQACLVNCIRHVLNDELECGAQDGGLDLAVYFKKNRDEERIIQAGLALGLELRGLSHYVGIPGQAGQAGQFGSHPPGLLLGFAALDIAEIERSVMLLASLFNQDPHTAHTAHTA